MKKCTKCGAEKTILGFYKSKGKKDGVRAECKECTKQYIGEYQNRDEYRASRRTYCKSRRDKLRISEQRYRDLHGDKIRARRLKYYRDRPEWRIAMLFRGRLNYALKGKKREKSALELLGCTLADARKHIESQFLEGMAWGNHGEWHIDHIKPLGGDGVDLTDLAQLKELCHYTNLQPLWAADNLAKSNKLAC